MSDLPPMPFPSDPVAALVAAPQDDGVLAVITGVDGPSYRPVGAMMAVLSDGRRVGSLSSGCVEKDIALHALEALSAGTPRHVLYGRGSPFLDIKLPCGGGLEILLLPNPDRAVLGDLARRQAARQPVTLEIDEDSGTLTLAETGETGRETRNGHSIFRVRLLPEPFFHVFGKGPEASTFAALVQAAGFPNLLLSPDDETLSWGRAAGCATRHLKSADLPDDLQPDPWSAIVLFFHDHEWEPPILLSALKTRAFYIGAQGSRRSRDARLAEMRALGADPADLARLRGPIGLIPSARDARTLAVSVLAEVLDEARRLTAPAPSDPLQGAAG